MATNNEMDERRGSIMGEPRDQYLLSMSVRMSSSEDAFKEFLLGDEKNTSLNHGDEDDDNVDRNTFSYFNNLALLWERKVY